LSIGASGNEIYEIEGCEDLSKSDGWRSLETVTFDTSPFIWTDSTRSNVPQRFYRVLVKPGPSGTQ